MLLKDKFLFLICFLTLFNFCINANAQNFTISGKIYDKTSLKSLNKASVSILNAKDSILVKYTWSNLDGSFKFSDLDSGEYILLINFPFFTDYVQKLTLQSIDKVYIGNVQLYPIANVIEEVVINGQIPIFKKLGDTLEYNAKALIVEPNSKVEDLLKQISGFNIDNQGRITAFGEKVNKVLIDGEEFFGDDPTLVTRNIRGDMVDKIQLFDKKTDKATFTGIDDGITNKTLNIKLKENSKNGFFGKVSASGGTDKYFESQAMLNVFNDRSKFAVFGITGNTGKVGLSRSELDNYGVNRTVFNIFQDGIITSLNIVDEQELNTDRYNGIGNPKAKSGGLHYDTKWNDGKESLNTNYTIGTLNVNGFNDLVKVNDLSSGVLKNNINQIFNNDAFRQRLDVTYQAKLSTSATLKISADGIIRNNEAESSFSNLIQKDNNSILNEGIRTLQLSGDHKQVNFSAQFNNRFKKNRRTLSWQVGASSFDYLSNGFLFNTNMFFNPDGTLKGIEMLDQYKTSAVNGHVLSSSITYTEPLSPSISLAFSYNVGYNKSKSEKFAFNPTVSGQYIDLDPDFSNRFKLNELNNQLESTASYNSTKIRFSLRGRLVWSDFNQTDLFTTIKYTKSTINFVPFTSFTRNLNPGESLSFYYNARIIQPTIEQIQPIRVNNDPLYIIKGNPSLNTAYSNAFSVNYSKTKAVTGTNILLDGSYILVNNPIVNTIDITTDGRSEISAINLAKRDQHIIRFRAFYIRNFGSKGYSLDIQYNRNPNYSINNSVLNRRLEQFFSTNIKFSQFKAKKYDVTTSLGPTYLRSIASLPQIPDNNSFGFVSNTQLNFYLPFKILISGSVVYAHQSATNVFNESIDIFSLNSSISKSFLKQDGLKFSISGNDLLNQNRGFNRQNIGTTNIQSSYATIQRYVLASLIWDFNKQKSNTQLK